MPLNTQTIFTDWKKNKPIISTNETIAQLKKEIEELKKVVDAEQALHRVCEDTIEKLKEGHDLIYKSLRSAEGTKEFMTAPEYECIAESIKDYIEENEQLKDITDKVLAEVIDNFGEKYLIGDLPDIVGEAFEERIEFKIQRGEFKKENDGLKEIIDEARRLCEEEGGVVGSDVMMLCY